MKALFLVCISCLMVNAVYSQDQNQDVDTVQLMQELRNTFRIKFPLPPIQSLKLVEDFVEEDQMTPRYMESLILPRRLQAGHPNCCYYASCTKLAENSASQWKEHFDDLSFQYLTETVAQTGYELLSIYDDQYDHYPGKKYILIQRSNDAVCLVGRMILYGQYLITFYVRTTEAAMDNTYAKSFLDSAELK